MALATSENISKEKVAFPLKWKIIGTNASLLLVTVFLLVAFASNLFNEDKTATIYESTLESSLSLAERFNTYFKGNQSTFEILRTFSLQVEKDGASHKADLFKGVFAKNEHAIAFAHWNLSSKGKIKNNDLMVYLENDLYLATHKLAPKSFLKGINISRFAQLENKEQGRIVRDLEFSNEPLWQLSFKKGNHLFLAFFSLEGPLKELNQSSQFKNFIIVADELLAVNGEQSDLGLNEKLKAVAKKVEKGASQVVGLKNNNVSFLAAISPISEDSFAFSLINDSIIYQASRFLREQSLYFSLFIFSFTVFMGVLLSRRMTSDLARLHDASLAFAQGDFNNSFEVKSKDEIGSLAITFKKMGQDILRYIEEMKDKARLEKEMEVARLVQESFIPQKEASFNKVKISSFYRPTSECSGDWWGSFEYGDKLILVVADATGHGVPAALLTATASGCLHQLEYDFTRGNRQTITASEILEVFNFAIHKMGGKVHMTAFALVVDSKTGKTTYSNASHNPPLLIKGALKTGKGNLEKDALIPLMDALGARLGQDLNSQYHENSFQLEEGDLIYLYSDGLVEQGDNEGKQWGNRRFYKELLGHLNQQAGHEALTSLSRHLLEELRLFSGSNNWDDDITLLSVGFFEGELSQTASSRFGYDEDAAILVCSESNEEIYGELLKELPFRLVARDNTEKERLLSLQQTLQAKGEQELSMDLAFGEVIKEVSLRITSSSQIEEQIETALESFDYDGYFDTPKNPFALLVRELSSNALYHQSQETTARNRDQSFKTDENHSIEVLLSQTASGLGVRVTDNSGRLNYEEFRRSLNRAFNEQTPEDKQGGAGLGLFMVFQNSNIVIIDINKNKRTQVLAVIEKERRYKNFRSKTTQLLFNERSL